MTSCAKKVSRLHLNRLGARFRDQVFLTGPCRKRSGGLFKQILKRLVLHDVLAEKGLEGAFVHHYLHTLLGQLFHDVLAEKGLELMSRASALTNVVDLERHLFLQTSLMKKGRSVKSRM